MSEPSPATAPVQYYVMRHKSRMGATRFDFFMALSSTKDMYCFTGEDRGTKAMGGASYYVSLDQDDGKKTKGDDHRQDQVGSQEHGLHALRWQRGPGSKEAKEGQQLRHDSCTCTSSIRCATATPASCTSRCRRLRPTARRRPSDRPRRVPGLEVARLQSRDPASLQVEVFKNREPKFNAESQMCQLDFRGRAARQLQEHPVDQARRRPELGELLMGKVDNDKFNVDFQYPYSALQALRSP